LGAWLVSCGGTTSGNFSTPGPSPGLAPLSKAEVGMIVQAAANAVGAPTMAIAVVDRAGRILAVYSNTTTPPMVPGNFGTLVPTTELAVALARTGAFFSNDQAPLSSRTVRFISGIHFPLGVNFTPNADLYGIENTNRGCELAAPGEFNPGQEVPRSGLINGAFPGLGILTGKADVNDSDQNAVNAGGVPLFRGNRVVGGIGVAIANDMHGDIAEFAAFTGASGAPGISALPSPLPDPGVVVIGGFTLPFVDNTRRPPGVSTGTFSASNYVIGHVPVDSPGSPPEGDLIGPKAGPIGGLTATEVRKIIDNAIATASVTRAAIRLPLGSRTRMVIAVADLDGKLIGLNRMPDATVFSIDVAATKARNMIYFNSASRTAADLTDVPMGTAVTNRTISFGAQPLYPPGIDNSGAGPFFNLFLRDVANPCTQGFQPSGPNQSGIVFFPGAVPLYRNGVLVGGLGISGDGVDQDHFITNGGSAGFEAPAAIRADQVFVRNVRLPYLKFPRNPTDGMAK